MTDRELLDFIETQGYTHVRELSDGTIVGLCRLLYTTGLCIDLDAWGWRRRYCFKRREDAITQIMRMQSGDDVPTGFVAQRGL